MINTRAPSETAGLSAKTSTDLPEIIVESQEALENNLSFRLDEDVSVQVENIDDSTNSLTSDHSSTGEERNTEGKLWWTGINIRLKLADARREQNDNSSLNTNTIERLALAIEQAILSPQTEANVTDKRQYINFSFDDVSYYVIPWNACGSWQVGAPSMFYNTLNACTDHLRPWRCS